MEEIQKKFLTLIIILLLVIGVAPFSFAAEQGGKIVFEAKEFTDLKELHERALLKITDSNGKVKFVSKAKVKNDKGKEITLDVLSTDQLLRIEEIKDGEYLYTYATTFFAETPDLTNSFDTLRRPIPKNVLHYGVTN